MKRLDSLSSPTKPLVKKGFRGIHIKPEVPNITAQHFTATVVDDALEAKRVNLQKTIDYYGTPSLDPARF